MQPVARWRPCGRLCSPKLKLGHYLVVGWRGHTLLPCYTWAGYGSRWTRYGRLSWRSDGQRHEHSSMVSRARRAEGHRKTVFRSSIP